MKKATLFLLLVAALGLGACDRGDDVPAADLVLLDGDIYSGDAKLGRAEAIAVLNETIVATGASADIRQWIGPDTRVIDLKGGFAMPGFNDAHLHLDNGGQRLLNVNLQGVPSLAEFQARIRAALAGRKAGEWIVGRGWDHSLWPQNRVPSLAEMDAVSTDYPIVMTRVDGHSAVVNSKALALAGIDATTVAPEGGAIIKDDTGAPTGWLIDRAMRLVGALIPKPDLARHKKGLVLALREMAENGVTSVQDDSVRGTGWLAFEALQELKKEGKLTARVTEWLPFEADIDTLKTLRKAGGTSDAWLKTGLLKINEDGSGGSLSAAMLEPYATAPDNRGLLIIAPDKLTEMVVARDAAGFQIALHAIGDRANRVALDAFAEAARLNQRFGARHRIEHAQFVAAADVPRFATLGVIASVQPSHLLNDMRWAPKVLGPAREAEAYRWRSFLAAGVHLPFGTDYPVELINPMRGLYAAITREFEAGGPQGGWNPKEKLTIAEAIHSYTAEAAFAEFEEHRKGLLANSMLADIVVLDRDITRASPEEILKTRVLMTIVGGRVVFERK